MTEQVTSGGPRCPNHKVALLSIGEVGRMQCPISECIFDVKTDDSKKKETYDKFGNIMHSYIIEGSDA
mgnify:CR=1 FL=1